LFSTLAMVTVSPAAWAREEVTGELASAQPSASPSDEANDVTGESAEGPLRVSMEFQDALLKDVLKTFSQQTGINVVAEGAIGNQPVTLYLEEVTALDALDQILRISNLTYERPPGSEIYIVKAAPKKDPAATMVSRLYRLNYARVSKSVLGRAAAAFGAITPFEGGAIDVTSTGGGAQGGGGQSRGGQSRGAQGGGAGATEQVGIDVVIKSLLSKDGSVIVDERTNGLLVTDAPENFPRIEGALAALDVRTPQILVEAEVLETSLSKVKDWGIEWGTKGDLITLTPGSRKTRFPFSWIGHGDAAGHTSADQFSLSTLDASSFKGVLQALETDTDTKVLARPKVLTLDNESAIIRLTADEAIGFETTTGEQTATTTSEPERQITGVILVVTPQTNADGYITMLVEPSVTKTVASKITPPSGQATPRDTKTRSARTLIRLRSGDTFVVGGLIDHNEEKAVDSVPVLSSIPLIGEAFKNTEVSNTSTELIVFVTPRLLEEPAQTRVAAASAAMTSELIVERGPEGVRGHAPQAAAQLSQLEAMEQTLNTLER